MKIGPEILAREAVREGLLQDEESRSGTREPLVTSVSAKLVASTSKKGTACWSN